MSDTANIVVTKQELRNIGVRCAITGCMINRNGPRLNGDGDLHRRLEGAPVAVLIPGLTLANIVITNGGGYATTIDTDPDFTDVRIFTGDGTRTSGLRPPHLTGPAGLLNATCISWVSTDAGDQQINVVYVGLNGVQYNASWDTDRDENDNDGFINDNDLPNTSLIKEWNRLESSLLTIEGVSQGALQDVFEVLRRRPRPGHRPVPVRQLRWGRRHPRFLPRQPHQQCRRQRGTDVARRRRLDR
ncbi:MAG: hypothetical protein IPF51_07615 [Dehalococcoidia bacterium]|uniref:hypothetical protein n=1 Tax=Candidatus Amarobacter glycogenicus TaxID=3140699 RepID=UPI0031356408|nr:hypothetical protein [Dehalococcoidia bacterium]